MGAFLGDNRYNGIVENFQECPLWMGGIIPRMYIFTAIEVAVLSIAFRELFQWTPSQHIETPFLGNSEPS